MDKARNFFGILCGHQQAGTEYVQHHVCRPVRYHFLHQQCAHAGSRRIALYNWETDIAREYIENPVDPVSPEKHYRNT